MEGNIEEFTEELNNLSRLKLINTCVKLKKRLNKLSDICDVEDVYRIYNENENAGRRAVLYDNAKKIIFDVLNKRNVEYNKWDKIDVLVNKLVTSFEDENSKAKSDILSILTRQGIQVDGNWKLSDCISMLISKLEKNQNK